jgi:hypothetical protein
MNRRFQSNGNSLFRFPLYSERERVEPVDDPVTDMIREQVRNILEIVGLTFKGKPVDVDGFSYVCNPGKIYDLYPEKD